MSVVGTDCPECGKRLNGDACRCGWQANAPADDRIPAWQRCHRCGDASKDTAFFHDDGAPEDRGLRLCPGCWASALQRRAERQPISAEARAALRHQLYADLDVIAARTAAVQRRSPAPKAEAP